MPKNRMDRKRFVKGVAALSILAVANGHAGVQQAARERPKETDTDRSGGSDDA
jgi:hypothetical protein